MVESSERQEVHSGHDCLCPPGHGTKIIYFQLEEKFLVPLCLILGYLFMDTLTKKFGK